MKKYIYFIVIAAGLLCAGNLHAQVGIGTHQPEKSAALEIRSQHRGLLIPQFQIDSATHKSMIAEEPANALLVYNTGGANLPEGFYAWRKTGANTGFWASIIAPGNKVGQVLMTQVRDGDTTAVWMDPLGFVKIGGSNGIAVTRINSDSLVIQLGGLLVKNTSIDVNGNTFSIKGLDSVATDSISGIVVLKNDSVLGRISPNQLFVSGLVADNGVHITADTLRLGGKLTEDTHINAADYGLYLDSLGAIQRRQISKILVQDSVGATRTVAIDSLFVGNTFAENGLHMRAGAVVLGGTLDTATTINTNATHVLAIKGLQDASAPNKILVVDTASVLRVITRSLYTDVNAAYDIDTDLANYSPYVQEIYITVPISALSSGDVDITLPDPTDAEGQEINIKITATATDPSDALNYVNIKDGGTVITYGAMAFQSWVLKSNGTAWQVLATN